MSKSGYSPRIYVSSLASYNAGKLHGVWIDLEDTTVEEVEQQIEAMLLECPEHGEEYAIHDYDLGGIKISENESIDDVIEIAQALESHGEALKVAFDNFSDVAQAISACEESYQGVFRTLEDWGDEYAEDTGLLNSIPENLRVYFDMERFVRDMEISGGIWTALGSEGIHVFFNN